MLIEVIGQEKPNRRFLKLTQKIIVFLCTTRAAVNFFYAHYEKCPCTVNALPPSFSVTLYGD